MSGRKEANSDVPLQMAVHVMTLERDVLLQQEYCGFTEMIITTRASFIFVTTMLIFYYHNHRHYYELLSFFLLMSAYILSVSLQFPLFSH